MPESTSPSFDLVLKNGKAVTPSGVITADIAVKNGKIADIGHNLHGRQEVDCKNLLILPGVIDTQVHFREPGLTHKEDLATGTLSAAFGGVTTVFEMPNTEPLTITADAMLDKLARAAGRAFVDYAFFMGGCRENMHLLHQLERMQGCCGVKIFMGSSTGALLAEDDETIFEILKSGKRRVALHAEDNARLDTRRLIAEESGDVHMHPVWRDEETALIAVKRAVKLARAAMRPIHLLHVTSAAEMAFLKHHKDIATIETTPQHLTLFAPDCYERLGTLAQMNPPIRDKEHQDALWQAINNGTVDVLGSDHAPHTLEEKAKRYPSSPSGMIGVQTMLPLMLHHMNNGRLSIERLVDLLCHAPQRIYQIAGKGRIAAGYDADFAIVDPNATWTITNQWIQSKCGWSPFDGMQVKGRVEGTILRGKMLMWGNEILESPFGKEVSFSDTFETFTGSHEDIAQPLRATCC